MGEDMDVFYGTKKIMATPMTRLAYNEYRGWELPADEDGSDAGYLVEYLDGGQSNHSAHAGYISWSPALVFERAYRASGSMGFGHALEALKEGERVARHGWNGKGMFLFLVNDIQNFTSEGDIARHLPETSVVVDFIMMRAADGNLVPWLCSQTDALAEDWCIL